jgi:tripartite-type tricarboxylate transporter receptor subunit TctC
MNRRTLLANAAAAICALSTGAALAQPDAYPSKPIKWIVPFPPAGARANIARALGAHKGR